jgi:hypothetical protein
MEPGSFTAQTGIVFSRERDELGLVDLAVATIDGDTVLFVARAKEDQQPHRPSELINVTARGDVRTVPSLLERVLQIASIDPGQLLWCNSDLEAREWALFRLDDNNNRFLMSYFGSRERAELVAQHYETLGHKQTYYVERAL